MPYDGTYIQWENRRASTENVVFGKVLYQPDGICGPRLQRDFELVTIHSGSGVVTVGEVTHRLTVGMVYLFLPGKREYFHFTSEGETRHSWCAIRRHFIPKSLAKQLRQSAFSAPSTDIFDSLLASAFKLRGPVQDDATKALIDQLGISLFNVFLYSSREPNPTDSDPAVRKFLHYLEDHFGEENCLQAARQAAGVSSNALLYKFNAAMQCTPAKYLWDHRIKRGIAMLSETGYTIAEISFQCGFKNPFHFSRKVKEQSGWSPRQIRQMAFEGKHPA